RFPQHGFFELVANFERDGHRARFLVEVMIKKREPRFQGMRHFGAVAQIAKNAEWHIGKTTLLHRDNGRLALIGGENRIRAPSLDFPARTAMEEGKRETIEELLHKSSRPYTRHSHRHSAARGFRKRVFQRVLVEPTVTKEYLIS